VSSRVLKADGRILRRAALGATSGNEALRVRPASDAIGGTYSALASMRDFHPRLAAHDASEMVRVIHTQQP
jgi:hypothetical protein